ncbi:MAG: hypothetical protein M3N53_10295 [Actinomycetota bacterium]|nr:hypothetical protein [Actinomycetota bacterium]
MSVWSQPPGGFTHQQRRQRRRCWIQAQLAVLAVAVMSVTTIAGYRWITAVNPVDRSHAIDLFRAERTDLAVGGRSEGPQDAPNQQPPRRKPDRAEAEKAAPLTRLRPGGGSTASSRVQHPTTARRSPRATGGSVEHGVAPPEEGVYSWATEGHEQVGGARREFPAETQRIITVGQDQTWNQHHYFSDERQIWTAFRAGSTGVEITQQRNKVTFGPVTRESEIDFSPPMLAAPRSLRVGLEWHGEWTGETYGSYASEVFEHTSMAIGGERVEVWGMTYVIDLRGEQEGQVNAEVWFAPGPGLTVKEHYVQDVDSGGARYHAEWTQTLKSLQPRQ